MAQAVRMKSQQVVDIVRGAIADLAPTLGLSEIKPLVGNVIIIAEITDEEGGSTLLTLDSPETTNWTHLGMLAGAVIDAEDRWTEGHRKIWEGE